MFTAAAAFGSLTSARQNPRDEYIPSLTPASVNVFQPSVDSFSPTSAKPYLPASRLLRVTPAAKTDERIHNLSQSSLRYIRIVPVANSRIRYSRLNTYSTRSVVLATLNFEVTPFTNFEVKLEAIELFVQGGAAENLGSSTGCELPVLCHARDDVAFVFRIAPDDGSLSSETALVRMLEVSIRATVLLSESYQPGISMQWATNVDFSLPLNSTFGGPSQVLQRNSRPTSFPMKPKDLISVEPPRHLYRKALSFKDLGVAVTLSAPACAEVGKQFDWDILIVNRSDKVRKFAMIVTPNNDEPPQKSTRQQMLALPESAVAHAVVDGHISFPATQNLAASNETTLLCLNPDIRVG